MSIDNQSELDTLWEDAEKAAKKNDIFAVLRAWNSLAEKGVWPIYARLGRLYERGAIGIDKDFQKALYWYKKAVSEGDDLIAHLGLGRIYFLGNGVERNPIQAYEHFMKACAQGSLDAALYLGILYVRGDGVGCDLVQAKKYLEMAAAGEYFYAFGMLSSIAFSERRFVKGILFSLKSYWLGRKFFKENPADPRLLGIEKDIAGGR